MENYICFVNFNYELTGNIKFGIYDRKREEFTRIIYNFNLKRTPCINHMTCISLNEAKETMHYYKEEVVFHDIKTLFVSPGINQDDIRHLDIIIFKLMEEMDLQENNKEMYDYLNNYRCVQLARFFSGFKVKTVDKKDFHFINEIMIEGNVYFVVREKKSVKFRPVEEFVII